MSREPQRLGASSLELLGHLATPAGGEVVLEIPLDRLRPDPDQPRRAPAGSSGTPQVRQDLQSLADNLRAVGFAQPLRVRPDPEGHSYTILTGERRWRAARLAGLATAPCLLDAEPREAHLRLALQLSENLQRRDLPLLDLAAALSRLREDYHLSDRQLAGLLGRSRSWLSHHLRALRASGLAREALEADLIRSAETLRLFEKAPTSTQRCLLRQARESRSPIPRGAVQRDSAVRPRGHPTRLRADRPPSHPTRSTQGAGAARATTADPAQLHTVGLTAGEWRRLFRALRSPLPPDPARWEDALRAVLRKLTSTG